MTIDNVSGGELIDPAWGNSVADELNARGIVAHAAVTANQASITTITDITGATVTWTADASRAYKVTAMSQGFSSVSGDTMTISITDAAGTSYSRGIVIFAAASGSVSVVAVEYLTGASGSTTRKLRAARFGSGSVTIEANSSYPTFIMVEDIGPA